MKVSSALPRCVLPMVGILGLVLASTTLSFPIVAQENATSAQEPAKQSNTEELPPLPESPIEKAQKDGSALPLSLKDVTKLALQNNLDIAIQDTNEETSKQKIIAAFGTYDPTLSGTLSTSSSKSSNNNRATASTGAFTTSKGFNWNVNYNQSVRTGGKVTAQMQSRRTTSDALFGYFNPEYSNTASVTFTQPLWKNLRIDSTRGQIKLTNLDLQTTDSQFKQKVTDTIANIQSQYWDLVSAIRDYEIKRSSVKLGQITLRDNTKKVEVGTLAPIGITEAKADLAQRELNLISSEESIIRQENALRQLISNDRNAEIWKKMIVPVDKPDFVEYKVDLDTAINTALRNRTELEQYDIQLRQSDIQLQMYSNNRKWQVDLQATYGSSGTAGTPFPSSALSVPTDHIGGLGTAFNNLFSEGLTNWSLQVNIQVPLRNRSADSQFAQQQISKRKTLIQRKSQEQSIQVEIRNAITKLETNKKQVETARINRSLNEEQLSGEEKRFQAGLSENYRVLERQNNLATAENTLLVNLINYKKSVITLQKAMNTLLESGEFAIAKGASVKVPDLK